MQINEFFAMAGAVLLVGSIVVTVLGFFAFWLWMLIDCAQSPEPPGNTSHRLTWILIIIFTGWIGAIIYYFVVRRPRETLRRSRSYTSPPMPPRMHA
jgi:biotin transporter BioY